MTEPISIAEARLRVLEEVRRLAAERVPLAELAGRVLAENVASGLDLPPFDNSAMDGFAVVAGPAVELRVIGESRAGHPAAATVEPGTAVRISTGAALPAGADAVVPVERTEGIRPPAGEANRPPAPDEPEVVRVPDTRPGENVRRAGEDVRAGTVVLRAGAPLGAAEVGVAAALGRGDLSCARRPRVALVVTGDELAEPGEPLGPGRIYGSNGQVLAAQVEHAGGVVAGREAVGDDAGATRAALQRALAGADVVVISGGVSVGPHDHVKGALSDLGAEERFWGVRLKPGKPTWFGVRPPVLVFGLPGNPVSAMVTFRLFVQPALAALQGADPAAARTTAVLAEPVALSPRREQAIRVRLELAPEGWRATSTGAQGSHRLTSMLGAGGLALLPAGDGELAAGDRVEIELL